MKIINLLFLLALFTLTAHAQSLPACDGLARACSAAADELKAARSLITAQAAEIEATKGRLEIEQARTALQTERAELYKSQADNLTASLTAEKQAKDALQKLSDEQTKRITNLEKRLGRSKAVTVGLVIAALAAAVALK